MDMVYYVNGELSSERAFLVALTRDYKKGYVWTVKKTVRDNTTLYEAIQQSLDDVPKYITITKEITDQDGVVWTQSRKVQAIDQVTGEPLFEKATRESMPSNFFVSGDF